jgi:hypothetical protein
MNLYDKNPIYPQMLLQWQQGLYAPKVHQPNEPWAQQKVKKLFS